MPYAGRGLGEWVLTNRAAERVLVAPARPGALIPASSSRRGPRPMFARLRLLCASSDPVQFATERVCG